MGKYDVKWCRIWEFTEEVEAETEEEVYEKILEERATAGSAIEILSVMPIDIEEVKLGSERVYLKGGEFIARTERAEQEIVSKAKGKQVAKKEKEKK